MVIEYENQDLLIINKPTGLPVYSTKKHEQEDSVVSWLLENYPAIRGVGEEERPGIVHRLDRQTSGLLVVAKNPGTYEYLKKSFASREIAKEYLALVHGETDKHGVITSPLTKIGHRGQSRVRVDEEGKEAVTEYWALGYYQSQPLSNSSLARGEGQLSTFPPQASGLRSHFGGVGWGGIKGEVAALDRFTLVRVKLHTGRTHQIRVHLAHIKHPVMGDDLYGKPWSQKLEKILERLFLHASRLEFQLPDGTWLEVESELPEDLQRVLSQFTAISNF